MLDTVTLTHPPAAPWPGFSMAAAAAAEHLLQQVPMDLWLVTEVVGPVQHVVAASGPWSTLAPAGSGVAWSQSFCVRMVAGAGPCVAPDVRQVPAYAELAVGTREQVRCYVGVPLLRADATVFGTLCGVAGRPGSTELASCLPVVSFAGRMLSTVLATEAVTAEYSQAAAHATALSERDPLTGLRNHRGWQHALTQEGERCRRYGSNASVIALDIDGFGADNERDGYDAGNVRLIACGQTVVAACRPSDIVARSGGDEFGVVAVECDAACARALVLRIRRSLRSAGLSVSVGVATRRVGEDLQRVWQRADEAMLVAKRRRRQLRDVQQARRRDDDHAGAE